MVFNCVLSNTQKGGLAFVTLAATVVCFSLIVKPQELHTFYRPLKAKFKLLTTTNLAGETESSNLFAEQRNNFTGTTKHPPGTNSDTNPLMTTSSQHVTHKHHENSSALASVNTQPSSSASTAAGTSFTTRHMPNMNKTKSETQMSWFPIQENNKTQKNINKESLMTEKEKGQTTIRPTTKSTPSNIEIQTETEENAVPNQEDNSMTSKEKQHVAFVKVHKAASSTMHNILTRYGIAHHLDILLPLRGIHVNQNDYHIPKNNIVPTEPGSKYSIQCNHLIFDYKEWAPMFPNDTVYVGIIREPFGQFLSAFVYYIYVYYSGYFTPVLEANNENPVEEFLNKTDLYMKGWKPNGVMINNRMSVDFGFPLNNFEESKSDKAKISEFIKDLDNVFDIILIAEMFDESLVLLRRLLNWETKDIIYMKVNVFNKKDRKSWVSRKEYPVHTMQQFAKFAAIDIALYDYFYDKFRKQVELQGEGFQKEVAAFKNLKNLVAEYCSDSYTKTPSWKMNIPQTQHTTGFTLTLEDCDLMKYPEGALTSKARQVQLERLHLDHFGKPLQEDHEEIKLNI